MLSLRELGFAALVCCTAVVFSEDVPQGPTTEGATMMNNAFGLDLLKKISPDGINAFFSPLSISVAFAMLSLGAKEKTLEEINKVFHFDEFNDPMALHQEFQKLLTTFSQGHSAFHLNLANRIYVSEKFQMLQNFVNDVEKYYQASVQSVNFSGQGLEESVNRWVDEKTDGHIKDIFSGHSLKDDSLLVLVNAIYFKGQWENPFEEEETMDEGFYVSASESVTVPMMNTEEEFHYAEDSDLNVQILEMPYKSNGTGVSMIVLLPQKEEISQLVSRLTPESFKNIVEKLKKEKVVVKIPKLKMEMGYSLRDTLNQMGVNDLFHSSDANLKAISDGPMEVSNVVHKAFVEVNEHGTEAFGATSMDLTYKKERGPEFIANRAFLFFIIFKDAGHRILFAGSVHNPTVATN